MKFTLYGFTLIELLVTMSVSLLLTFVGIVALRDSQRKQLLRKAKSQLVVGLEKARNDAFFGKKSSTCDGFLGNEFSVDTTEPSYTIMENCTAGGSATPVSTYIFNNDVTLNTNTLSFTFTSVSQGTDLASDAVYGITIDGGFTERVTVRKSGIIE